MQRPPRSYDQRRTRTAKKSPEQRPGASSISRQTRGSQGTSIPLPNLHLTQSKVSAASVSNIQQSTAMPIQQASLYAQSEPIARLPRSRKQKFFITLAFLITLGLVIYMPILAFRQYYFPNSSNAGNNNPVSIVPSGLMGKPILPLPGQIMTGVSLGNQPLDAFERDAGKKVSLMLDYQAWGSTDGTQYFPVSWANSVRQHGSIPVIAWEPWVPGVYPQDVNQPTYALENIITGKFDPYIHQWALAAKNWRGPFFLRFAPEMNANWTPWSENVNGNTPGEFVQTWRHVYNIFKAVNATNVTWVWNPNLIFRAKGALPLSEFYPGDAYVDWTALDGFNAGRIDNKGRWDTFSQLFQPSYSAILKFSLKPMMIAEMGCVEQGGSKAAWITDAFSTELPKKFPNIKAFAWFNHPDTKQDWRIETSPGSQAAFAEMMRSPLYASDDFANYLGG